MKQALEIPNNSTMNNSPINSTINSTTVGELADATSLSAPQSSKIYEMQYEFSYDLPINPKI